jgi:hypothetical protein
MTALLTRLYVCAALPLLLCACQGNEVVEAQAKDPLENAVPEHRIDPARLAAASKALEGEPKVVDFLLDPELAVPLQVAVKDDGTRRYGLAGYFCLKMTEWGIDTGHNAVRIVDAARLSEADGDFQSISLGTISCGTEQRWD